MKLTERQQQIVDGIKQGKTDKEIASDIGVKPTTINDHLRRLFRRLKVHSRIQLLKALSCLW